MADVHNIHNIELPKGFSWYRSDDNMTNNVIMFQNRFNFLTFFGALWLGVCSLITIIFLIVSLPYFCFLLMGMMGLMGLIVLIIGLIQLSHSRLFITIQQEAIIFEVGNKYTGEGTEFVRDAQQTVVQTVQAEIKSMGTIKYIKYGVERNGVDICVRHIIVASVDQSKSMMICKYVYPKKVDSYVKTIEALIAR